MINKIRCSVMCMVKKFGESLFVMFLFAYLKKKKKDPAKPLF